MVLPWLMAGLAVALAAAVVLVLREWLRQERRPATLSNGLYLSLLAGLAPAVAWWLTNWSLLA
jgi:hypothetical protein